MVEILWRSMAQGIWIQQVFACVFLSFSFLGHWKGIMTLANYYSIKAHKA
jgi:hypothetical protein